MRYSDTMTASMSVKDFKSKSGPFLFRHYSTLPYPPDFLLLIAKFGSSVTLRP